MGRKEASEVEEEEIGQEKNTGGNSINKEKELAVQKIADALFNTPKDRMAELTLIPRRQVLSLSMMEAFEHMFDVGRKKPLRQIWRESYYSHMRSVGQSHLNRAAMLAETQMTSEETPEEFEPMEI